MRLIRSSEDPERALSESLSVLARGGIVACATETYYGLCARYDDEAALERLFELKGLGRGAKPFPLIIGSMDALKLIAAETGPLFMKLAGKFWPGPLTLLVRARPDLLRRIAAHGKTAVRMPGDSFALALATAFALPLTATSANPSGLKPAKDAAQAAKYFGDGVDLIVDSGEAPGGPPSTIVDATGGAPGLLREGAIGFRDIERYLRGGG